MLDLVNSIKSETPTIAFDYQALTLVQQQSIQQKTGEIRARLRRSAQDIWEIGQRLTEVRSQLKHGQFDAWLKAEFGWSRRTAYNFISVYETFQEHANFAQIDIATSALYLISAPSTAPEIRNEMIERAQNGEKITHQALKQAIKAHKEAQANTESAAHQKVRMARRSPSQSQPFEGVKDKSPDSARQLHNIIAVIPKSVPPSEESQSDENLAQPLSQDSETIKPQSAAPILPLSHVSSGWHCLGGQHWLFCGDTASPEFFNRIPTASLAIAITSIDWDHDWLVEKADSVIILRESALADISIEQLITTFSKVNEIVVFPWLPDSEMIAIAHRLNRGVLAGDPDPGRCARALAASQLKALPIQST